MKAKFSLGELFSKNLLIGLSNIYKNLLFFKQSSERVYFEIDTLEKLVTQDQKDGKPLMIGEENISEFLSNSDVQNKKWNVSTLTTEEIQGK